MSKRNTEGITEPQTRTLRAICQIFDSTGLPPTVKELAEVLGISHASAHGGQFRGQGCVAGFDNLIEGASRPQTEPRIHHFPPVVAQINRPPR